MTELVLGGEALDVRLDGGQSAFTARVDGAVLTLSAEGGEAWTVNGLALKILEHSGISELALSLGGRTVVLNAAQPLTGDVYARLCAEGVASSEYDYQITGDGILVTVSGSAYRLGDAGELIPMEGD